MYVCVYIYYIYMYIHIGSTPHTIVRASVLICRFPAIPVKNYPSRVNPVETSKLGRSSVAGFPTGFAH